MTMGVLSILLAVAATVLAFIFIIPNKCRAKLPGVGKFVHDLCNFKFLIIEKILQFCYVLSTSYVIIMGFFTLFETVRTWEGRRWVGYYGLILMVLGPVVIRLAYELLMMAILAVKNIIQINNKLKNQNDEGGDASPFAVPVTNEYIPQKNQAAPPAFCVKCGTPIGPNGQCPNPNCNGQ